jgi:hypothetical protein
MDDHADFLGSSSYADQPPSAYVHSFGSSIANLSDLGLRAVFRQNASIDHALYPSDHLANQTLRYPRVRGGGADQIANNPLMRPAAHLTGCTHVLPLSWRP